MTRPPRHKSGKPTEAAFEPVPEIRCGHAHQLYTRRSAPQVPSFRIQNDMDPRQRRSVTNPHGTSLFGGVIGGVQTTNHETATPFATTSVTGSATVQRISFARRIAGTASLALLLCGISWSAEAYKSPASIETMDDATRDQIRAVVRANIDDVRRCYDQALDGNPALAGRVVLSYKKKHSDKKGHARVESSDDGLGPVARCTAKAMSDWDFGEFTGGFSYPFEFAPGE